MDHVSIVYGILHGFDELPPLPQWELIDQAVRARQSRDHERLLEILEQIGEPQSDSVGFAVEFLSTSLNIHRGDVAAAKRHAGRLENHHLCSIPLYKAAADSVLGPLLQIDRNYEEAVVRLLAASAVFREHSWDLMEAFCLAEIGGVQFARGDAFGALESFLSALPVIEKSGHPGTNAILMNIATLALRMSDYDLALQRLGQLLEVEPYIHTGGDRANLLTVMATAYKYKLEYHRASKCYAEALSMISRDEHPTMYLRVKVGMADLAMREDDPGQAAQDIEDVNDLDLTKIFPARISDFLTTKAELSSKLGHHEEAREIFRQALELTRAVANDEGIKNLLDAALESVTDGETRRFLLEEYWNVGKKAATVAKDGVRAMLSMRSRYEQEKSRIALERQKELGNAIAETQLLTMNDIGRDLHDSIGQDVTVLSMLVDRLRATPSNADVEVVGILETMQTVTQRVAVDSRRIAHRLMSKTVTAQNLLGALAELNTELSVAAPSLGVELHHTGSIEAMTDEVALTFYRIVQATVKNVVRHAEASTCTINLVAHDDHFHLGIEDDGKGFDPRSVTNGIGLRETKARAELVGGKVRIESHTGSGTYVEVVVPRR